MALNRWSRRSLVAVAAICAIGGFLIGSSSSDDARRRIRPGDDETLGPVRPADSAKYQGNVGRYQMIASSGGGTIVFDTATARYWWTPNRTDVNGTYPDPHSWRLVGSPFEKESR